MSKEIALTKLTAEEAKTWLVTNDPEAAEFWRSIAGKDKLIGAVEDNLADFGINIQSGEVIITSDRECFQDDYIRSKRI